MKSNTAVLLLIVVLLLIAIAPLALIWALNTLFSLSIAFTVKTWLAALLLLLATEGIRATFSAKK